MRASIRSPRVIEVLAKLISVHGAPMYIGYNEVRPHSSLGQLTLAEFKLKLSQHHPTMAIPK